MKFDAYQMVTDRICALLEQGIKPWAQPLVSTTNCAWSGNNGHPYSFLNHMLLADPEKEYKTLSELMADVRGEWVTFHQALERGGNVKKGEKGRKIVFFKALPLKKDEKDKEGSEDEEQKFVPYLTVYTVFNISQCEGLRQKYHTDEDKFYDFVADDSADRVAADYIEREGITFKQIKGANAFYRPSEDMVVLPVPEQFESTAEYYSTLYHELTHSTGHPKRLNRLSETAAYGKEDYSREELVAEIGAASLCATLGIDTNASLTNSAAYVANWLKALRNDKKMIVWASSRAEKAVKMILNIQEE